MNEETARTVEQTKTDSIVRKSRYLLNDPSISKLNSVSVGRDSIGSTVDPFYRLQDKRKNAIEFVS